jgi:xanthine dehydrogenase accessory factor
VKDIIDELAVFVSSGDDIVVATVVSTWGSAPRTVGSTMAITEVGQILGSVSGGCVEGAVAEIAKKVFKSGTPRLLEFGIADDTAWKVGLACGGKISVFVQMLDVDMFWLRKSKNAVKNAVLTVIDGSESLLGKQLIVFEADSYKGSLNTALDPIALNLANNILQSGVSTLTKIDDDTSVFIEVNSINPTLVLVGGVHISIPLSQIAKIMCYRTIVIDPRRAFGNKERFPHVDQIIHLWPDIAFETIELNNTTAIAVLTHDPKIDDAALMTALPSQAFYVGALGSKKTNTLRNIRLSESGLSSKYIDRLAAPIGLDIGGRSPEEIALAVMAEIISAQYTKD